MSIHCIALQLKAAQAAAAAAAASNPTLGSPAAASLEELHAQVVRLKRQRDRLTRDQQELSRALAEAQEAAAAARQEAGAATVSFELWRCWCALVGAAETLCRQLVVKQVQHQLAVVSILL